MLHGKTETPKSVYPETERRSSRSSPPENRDQTVLRKDGNHKKQEIGQSFQVRTYAQIPPPDFPLSSRLGSSPGSFIASRSPDAVTSRALLSGLPCSTERPKPRNPCIPKPRDARHARRPLKTGAKQFSGKTETIKSRKSGNRFKSG